MTLNISNLVDMIKRIVVQMRMKMISIERIKSNSCIKNLVKNIKINTNMITMTLN
jgi:hypothetical protein